MACVPDVAGQLARCQPHTLAVGRRPAAGAGGPIRVPRVPRRVVHRALRQRHHVWIGPTSRRRAAPQRRRPRCYRRRFCRRRLRHVDHDGWRRGCCRRPDRRQCRRGHGGSRSGTVLAGDAARRRRCRSRRHLRPSSMATRAGRETCAGGAAHDNVCPPSVRLCDADRSRRIRTLPADMHGTAAVFAGHRRRQRWHRTARKSCARTATQQSPSTMPTPCATDAVDAHAVAVTVRGQRQMQRRARARAFSRQTRVYVAVAEPRRVQFGRRSPLRSAVGVCAARMCARSACLGTVRACARWVCGARCAGVASSGSGVHDVDRKRRQVRLCGAGTAAFAERYAIQEVGLLTKRHGTLLRTVFLDRPRPPGRRRGTHHVAVASHVRDAVHPPVAAHLAAAAQLARKRQ